MIKNAKEMISENRVLSFISLIALVIGCIISVGTGIGLSNLVVGICTSTVVAYIFFIFQVVIPANRRKKVVGPIIKERLSRICAGMNECFEQLGQLYVPDNQSHIYSSEELREMMNIRFKDCTNVTKLHKATSIYDEIIRKNTYTIGEYLLECVIRCEEEIDRLFRHYGSDITLAVDDVLEKILQSNFHNRIKSFANCNIDVGFSNDVNFMEEYWELKIKLEKELEEYD